MREILERLQAALADRYTIEREVGAGGMATVYLAQDLRHHRAVAIKVLRPDLGAILGKGRFLREIQMAASLSHPNILPLFDSGEAGELIFYAMPFVEGETLATRLERETQLPIEDALAIAREVADALAYAHAHGIVHRDIKPANILLSGQHAVVADFGIARAIGVADTHQLTSAGVAMGTPSYMSPEQGAGAVTIDGRSDIYSLGCVLYEMLIGEPPFGGPTAQVIVARHSSAQLPGLRAVRTTIPEGLEFAVERALAKSPADRFATAAQFAEALAAPDAVTRPGRGRMPAATIARRRARVVWTAGIVTLLVVVAAVAGSLWSGRGPVAADSAVAVLPFRAADGSSPSARAAASAMTVLVAERLNGEGGPRALDPATVSAAVRRTAGSDSAALTLSDALRVAHELGAGVIVLGQVSEVGGSVVFSASLTRVPGGTVLARVENTAGPSDSLLPMADRMVAALLVRNATEPVERHAVLLAAPLPAVRSYLAGRMSFRRGSYAQAARQYTDALAADPTLAVAGLGLSAASKMLGAFDDTSGTALAWASRHTLGPVDSMYLTAVAGRNYPAASSHAERLRAWEDVVAVAPDRVDAWFQLGEQLFGRARQLGVPGGRERAAAAFRHAMELDSTFIPALGYLVDIAASSGDSAEVRRLGARYLARDSSGEVADYYRWRIAVAVSDTAFLTSFRSQFDVISLETLDRIVSVAQLDAVAMDDARRAAEAMRRRSSGRAETNWAQVKLREIALNRGRPAEAAAITREFRGSAGPLPGQRLNYEIEALFWGADSAGAAALAEETGRMAAAAPDAPTDPFSRSYYLVCASGLWQASRGHYDDATRALGRLQRVHGAFNHVQSGYVGVCAALLDAEIAAGQHHPDAARRLQRLDSLMQTGPQATTWILSAANLTVARLQEENGNLAAALAATRRRFDTFVPKRMLVALSTQLREEGRLSALTGDREGAIRAYRSYLALRSDPEPSVSGEVGRIRTELNRLLNRSVAATR